MNRIIWLDMDGCLTDFVGNFVRHKNQDPNSLPDEILWPLVREIPRFWADMPWMPDGKDLWTYVRQFGEVKILTSPSRSDERSKPEKLEWVQRELGNVEVIFAKGGTKASHLKRGDILIDDLMKNIKNVTEGHGILHTSTNKTIAHLEMLLK